MPSPAKCCHVKADIRRLSVPKPEPLCRQPIFATEPSRQLAVAAVGGVAALHIDADPLLETGDWQDLERPLARVDRAPGSDQSCCPGIVSPKSCGPARIGRGRGLKEGTGTWRRSVGARSPPLPDG